MINMKIAVVGSRKFTQPDLVRAILNDLLAEITVFISGGASGVDTIAEEWIDEWNKDIVKEHPEGLIKKIIIEPNWDDLSHPDALIKYKNGKRYDARAGMRRNKVIIKEADRVIAFWDGLSTGTKNSIDWAIKLKKPLDIYVR